MSKLTYLVIHCTATPEGRNITKQDIIRMHTAAPPIGRGWQKVGYSDLIMLDGTILNLMPYNENDQVDPWEITNGVAGKNSICRHVVYAGGCDPHLNPKNTLTQKQNEALVAYVKKTIAFHPSIKVVGHNQLDHKKACPSFHVPFWCQAFGISETNYLKAA
jgi:N-acetylmuramoyl-L-alanine amidase